MKVPLKHRIKWFLFGMCSLFGTVRPVQAQLEEAKKIAAKMLRKE